MAGAEHEQGEVDEESVEAGSSGGDAEDVRFEGEPIAGQTSITVEDFKRVWWVLPQNRGAAKSLALISFGVPGFYAIQQWVMPGGSSSPVNWAFFVAAGTLPPGLAWALWRGRARWAQNAVNDLRSQQGVAFRFDAEGISVDAPGRKVTLTWTALAHFLEAPESFLVYTTPAVVMVVPKRAFSAEDQARLRTALTELVPKRPLRGVKPHAQRSLLLWVVLIVAFLAIWQFLQR